MRRLLRYFLVWLDLVDTVMWEDPVEWVYLRCPGCRGNLAKGKVRSTFVYSTRVTEYKCPDCNQHHIFHTEKYIGKEPVPFLLTGKLKKEYDRRYRFGKTKIAN